MKDASKFVFLNTTRGNMVTLGQEFPKHSKEQTNYFNTKKTHPAAFYNPLCSWAMSLFNDFFAIFLYLQLKKTNKQTQL